MNMMMLTLNPLSSYQIWIQTLGTKIELGPLEPELHLAGSFGDRSPLRNEGLIPSAAGNAAGRQP